MALTGASLLVLDSSVFGFTLPPKTSSCAASSVSTWPAMLGFSPLARNSMWSGASALAVGKAKGYVLLVLGFVTLGLPLSLHGLACAGSLLVVCDATCSGSAMLIRSFQCLGSLVVILRWLHLGPFPSLKSRSCSGSLMLLSGALQPGPLFLPSACDSSLIGLPLLARSSSCIGFVLLVVACCHLASSILPRSFRCLGASLSAPARSRSGASTSAPSLTTLDLSMPLQNSGCLGSSLLVGGLACLGRFLLVVLCAELGLLSSLRSAACLEFSSSASSTRLGPLYLLPVISCQHLDFSLSSRSLAYPGSLPPILASTSSGPSSSPRSLSHTGSLTPVPGVRGGALHSSGAVPVTACTDLGAPPSIRSPGRPGASLFAPAVAHTGFSISSRACVGSSPPCSKSTCLDASMSVLGAHLDLSSLPKSSARPAPFASLVDAHLDAPPLPRRLA